MDIRKITSVETHILRQQVLRPLQQPPDQVYPNDDAPDTLHAGAFHAGQLVGIATVFREPPPGENNPRAWRLRGMAVAPAMQRQGIGHALIEFCVAHIHAHGGTALWCYGRSSARAFYAALGFRTIGAEFNIPASGAHFVFRREWM